MRENYIFLRHSCTYIQYDSFGFIAPSVIQQYAFSRSRLLDFTGVKIPIFPSLPLNPCILIMRIDLVSSKTLKH